MEIDSSLPEDPEMQAVVQQFLDTLGELRVGSGLLSCCFRPGRRLLGACCSNETPLSTLHIDNQPAFTSPRRAGPPSEQ